MKKLNWLKISALSLFLFLASLPARAAGGLSDAFSDNGPLNDIAVKAGFNKDLSITQIVGIMVQSLLGLLGVIFVILVIYGGFTWMTAEGDESKVEKAQKILRNGTIGLLIVISAYAISVFVINALTQRTLVG